MQPSNTCLEIIVVPSLITTSSKLIQLQNASTSIILTLFEQITFLINELSLNE